MKLPLLSKDLKCLSQETLYKLLPILTEMFKRVCRVIAKSKAILKISHANESCTNTMKNGLLKCFLGFTGRSIYKLTRPLKRIVLLVQHYHDLLLIKETLTF